MWFIIYMVIIIIALNVVGVLFFKFYFVNVPLTKNYVIKYWEDGGKGSTCRESV